MKGRGEEDDSCFDLHMIKCLPIWLHFSGSLPPVCCIRRLISIKKNLNKPSLKHLQVDYEKLYKSK